jgi:hypothetical protein
LLILLKVSVRAVTVFDTILDVFGSTTPTDVSGIATGRFLGDLLGAKASTVGLVVCSMRACSSSQCVANRARMRRRNKKQKKKKKKKEGQEEENKNSRKIYSFGVEGGVCVWLG